MRTLRLIEVMTEAEDVARVIFHIEISATVISVLDLPGDFYSSRLQFFIQRVSILDPNVGIPTGIWIHPTIRAAMAWRTNTLEHNDDTISVNHDELRWLTPNPVKLKPQFIAIKLRRLEDVVNNKVRGNGM
jgi:hypothetical protein